MSYDSWTCLMVRNGPGIVPEDVSNALKMAACDLHLSRSDRKAIHSDACDGYVETEWNTQSVGARSGVLFRSQVFAKDGDYLVNFLLSVEDLDRGATRLRELFEAGAGTWVSREGKIPCEALYAFRDLRERYRRSLN